jgi:very-short-patch-repair endonuclease
LINLFFGVNCFRMKEQIINFINEKYKGTTRFLKPKMFIEKFGKDAYNLIESSIPWINEPFSLKVFCYINDILNEPKCKTCGNSVPFNCSELVFQTYCSRKCMFDDNETIQNVKRKTCMEKYGAINVLASNYGKTKLKNTMIEKYGTDNYAKTDEYKERIRNGDIIIPKNGKQIGLTMMKNHYNILEEKYPNVIPMFKLEEYYGSGDYRIEYDWKCKKCSHLFKRCLNFNYPLACPKCNRHGTNIERFIHDYLHHKNISYTIRNRKILKNLELDVYIPERKIAIECNGLYWHSDEKKSKRYHLEKTESCEKLGIRLLQIFSDEIELRPKAMINRLNNIFNLNKIKINSNKCELKEIDHNLSEKFLLKYHLEGPDKSAHRYGIFYKNRLLSIMTFEKCKTDGIYFYSRYCTINGVEVIDGDIKMMEYFKNKVNPKKIIAKPCRRWNTSLHYKKLGFAFVEKIKPNYWYIDNKYIQRYNRFAFAKQFLKEKLENFDPNLSERENMINHGYKRIYDCGSLKYELNV